MYILQIVATQSSPAELGFNLSLIYFKENGQLVLIGMYNLS